MPLKKKSSAKRRALHKARKSFHKRYLKLSQAQGRKVEKIELLADSGYHCVSITFQDKTDLDVVIDPGFSFRASLYDWKTGNQKVLKRWPVVRSEP
jgi:hypothetical protein